MNELLRQQTGTLSSMPSPSLSTLSKYWRSPPLLERNETSREEGAFSFYSCESFRVLCVSTGYRHSPRSLYDAKIPSSLKEYAEKIGCRFWQEKSGSPAPSQSEERSRNRSVSGTRNQHHRLPLERERTGQLHSRQKQESSQKAGKIPDL